MENNIKIISTLNSNSYVRAFQIAQLNFYLFSQEEKMTKKRLRMKNPVSKSDRSQ